MTVWVLFVGDQGDELEELLIGIFWLWSGEMGKELFLDFGGEMLDDWFCILGEFWENLVDLFDIALDCSLFFAGNAEEIASSQLSHLSFVKFQQFFHFLLFLLPLSHFFLGVLLKHGDNFLHLRLPALTLLLSIDILIVLFVIVVMEVSNVLLVVRLHQLLTLMRVDLHKLVSILLITHKSHLPSIDTLLFL